MDFILPVLRDLLVEFRDAGYRIRRFDDYWEQPGDKGAGGAEKTLLLRHDVDRFPATAVTTAKLEADLGVHGTYFFRTRPGVLTEKHVREIASLGHEIGYHYECLADTRGDFDAAFRLVEKDLREMRRFAPVVSASMHSRPFSPFDGRTLWDKRPLSDFGLKGEAYRSIDHHSFLYLADSGRNWGGNRNVVWDTVNGAQAPGIRSTHELMRLVRSGGFGNVQLLIHPNRWPRTQIGWAAQWGMDTAINTLKSGIKFARARKTNRLAVTR